MLRSFECRFSSFPVNGRKWKVDDRETDLTPSLLSFCLRTARRLQARVAVEKQRGWTRLVEVAPEVRLSLSLSLPAIVILLRHIHANMLELVVINDTDFTLNPLATVALDGLTRASPQPAQPRSTGSAGLYEPKFPIGGRAAVLQPYRIDGDRAIILYAAKHNGLQFPVHCGAAFISSHEAILEGRENTLKQTDEEEVTVTDAASGLQARFLLFSRKPH